MMATYNRASYIGDAIRSVLAQTYQDWELIVIDDGSTDDTESIVRGFAETRIRYSRHAVNQGISATRRDAVAASKGTYLAVLDSDDIWTDPEKLATQVAFLENSPQHVIVGTFIRLIDATGAMTGKDTYHTDDVSIRAHILIRNQFAHSSVVMRAQAVLDCGGYGTMPLAEDLDLFLRLGTQGKLANIPLRMTSYRVHGAGASRNARAMAHAVHGMIREHTRDYPNALKALGKSYARILLATLKSRA